MAQPLCLHKEEIDTFDCSVNVLTVATHLGSHLSLKTTAEPPQMDLSHRQTPYLYVHILIVVPAMYKIKLCNTYSILYLPQMDTSPKWMIFWLQGFL